MVDRIDDAKNKCAFVYAFSLRFYVTLNFVSVFTLNKRTKTDQR